MVELIVLFIILAIVMFRISQDEDSRQNMFSLVVDDPWLYYIQIGEKTVEGRSGSLEKFKKHIGKKAIFYNKDRKFPVLIKDVRHYDTLYEYLDEEGYENVLPDIESYEKAVEIYHKFYSDEKIKNAGGMNALVIELIKD